MIRQSPAIGFTIAFAVFTSSSAETITVCAQGCDYTSINTALALSQDGDVIQLSAETYQENAPIDFLGKAVVLRGTTDARGTPSSILDGQGKHRVLQFLGGETPATRLENVVVQNGRATDGAGIGISASSPTITGCVFRTNVADAQGGFGAAGGGVWIYEGQPRLLNCTFRENDAASGGGIYNRGGQLHVQDCLFSSNAATRGAAIYVNSYAADGTSLEVHNAIFQENHAEVSGGGVYFDGGFSDASGATIKESFFSANSANDRGGAVYVGDLSLIDLESCLITQNSAGVTGGAIFCNPKGLVAILDCSMWCNAPNAVTGPIQNNGGNCVREDCIPCDPPEDSDGDGVPDDRDQCPGEDDRLDTDQDGTPDCVDLCPADPLKSEPGRCGCGVVDTTVRGDFNCDGVYDELDYLAMQADLGICAADLNGDGVVSGADLGLLFVAWGMCP